MSTDTITETIEVRGLRWATESNVIEAVLSRRPGVIAVDANPITQTATVTFNPAVASITDLRDWVRDCGYHCAGLSVPDHLCEPVPAGADAGHDHHGAGGASMEVIAADICNRFLVAVVFALVITGPTRLSGGGAVCS